MSSEQEVAKPAVLSLELLPEDYETTSIDWFTPGILTGTLIFVIGCCIFTYYHLRWRPERRRRERHAKLKAVPYSELPDSMKIHYTQHALRLLETDTRNPSMWLEVAQASAATAHNSPDVKIVPELAQCVDYWQLCRLYKRYPEATGSLNSYLGQVYYERYKAKKYKSYL